MPRLRPTSQEGGVKKKSWPLRRTPIKQKSEQGYEIDRLSRLLKAVVLRRYHNRCVGPLTVYCPTLDASHIFPKGKYKQSRFLIDNVILQCRWCHDWYGNNPTAATEWIERYLGTCKYRQLKQQVRLREPEA